MDNNNNEISVTQALNQIQSWINAGDFDHAYQGSQEILEIEPENQRALALLKQAELGRQQVKPATPTPPAPVTPSPVPQPPVPAPTPPTTKELKIESDPNLFGENDLKRGKSDRGKMLLAIFIPAILVVLIGGGVIWALSNQQREDIIADNSGSTSSEEIIENNEFQDRNEERLTDLSLISQLLEDYYDENGLYPAVGQVDEVLLNTKDFEKIPLDPKHGEVDDSGKSFGYIYAVYNRNSEFILSALYEDNEGVAYEWTTGADDNGYDDYRDLKKPFVHLLGEAKGNPKSKVRRSTN